MGQKLVDICDIFETLQPKGLARLRITIEQFTDVLGTPETLHTAEVSVGERGKKRVLRIAKNATKPYTSTQQAATVPPTKQGASDA